MLPRPRGYNHDVRYRGEVFHIQSEVCGHAHRQVRTQLFSKGAVLATERTPVEDDDDESVESMLRLQHKALLRELCAGTFDAWLPGALRDEVPRTHARDAVAPQQLAVRRHGTALEIRGRDANDRCELAIEVCHGADILAVRRVAYEVDDDARRVEEMLQVEVEQMVAKVRRGGLDARLPTPTFVFVPPPIPSR
jgi:hypothetical protein